MEREEYKLVTVMSRESKGSLHWVCEAFHSFAVEIMKVIKDVDARLKNMEKDLREVEQNMDTHSREIYALKKRLADVDKVI
jgi:23S rRNA maturation-related 3'-5' exoribonuclease YhaM